MKKVDLILNPMEQKGYVAQSNWPYDGFASVVINSTRQLNTQPILQSDNITSTDPAMRDVVAAYEGLTM